MEETMHGVSKKTAAAARPAGGSADAAGGQAGSPVAPALSPTVVSGSVRILDFILTAAIGLAVYYAYVFPGDPQLLASYLMASLATAAITVVTFQVFGLYSIAALRGLGLQIGRLAAAWSLVFGVLLAGLLVTRAAHGLRRPVVTGVAVVCVLLMTAPTPFWLWDTAHDPRVWDPAARWTPLQCALLPTFKAGPALTLYALTLGLAVVGPRRALGSPHGTDAPRGSGPSASSEGGLVQVHQPQVGGLELPQADAELG